MKRAPFLSTEPCYLMQVVITNAISSTRNRMTGSTTQMSPEILDVLIDRSIPGRPVNNTYPTLEKSLQGSGTLRQQRILVSSYHTG